MSNLIKEIQLGNHHIIYDAAVVDEINVVIFDPASHQNEGSLRGQAQGRGTTYFIDIGGIECVLRHYRRGGLVAKVLRDQYIWNGIKNSRAWREWHLLEQMLKIGLPAPHPVAAQVVRNGFYYCADLITQRIENAQALSAILQTAPLAEQQWHKLGATIKRFHVAGIYHADLNAQNILINTENQMYLIDFDKGQRRKPRRMWQQHNLSRLLRSLNKSQQMCNTFYFSDNDWQALLQGYQGEG